MAGGGGGAPLSDETPESTGGADAGVGTSASRDDHAHNVPNATTTTRGISEKATGGEATTGTNNEAHMTPQCGCLRCLPPVQATLTR